jgi:hypothetical protein
MRGSCTRVGDVEFDKARCLTARKMADSDGLSEVVNSSSCFGGVGKG